MSHAFLSSATLPGLSALFCITFFFLWRRQRENRCTLNWALAYAFGALGSATGLMRLFTEHAASITFVGNVFFIGMGFFAVRGSNLGHTTRSQDRVMVPILAVTIICSLWFVAIEPSVFWRGTTSSVGGAAMFLLAAYIKLKDEDRDRIDDLTAIAFLVTAAALLARPVVTYLYEGAIQSDTESPDSIWFVSFRFFAALSWLSIAILFLFRINTDRLKDLAYQSLTDPLTGILNRRGLLGVGEGMVQEASQAKPVTLLICDIDHFKSINDTYGHRVGDGVIRDFAEVLRRAAADAGYAVGRIGGEEFVALLPATALARGKAFADHIRTTFLNRSHKGVPASHVVSVSIGIAETTGGESLDALIERADRALYRAKDGGRNRVEDMSGPNPAFRLPLAS
jgi:diguanylate cyclase (GGDEF)-like protein